MADRSTRRGPAGRFARRYGPWAVVAGASEGLGRAFADAIAARGVSVALVARRAEPLRTAATEIGAANGVDAIAIVADLGAPDAHTVIAEAMGDREVGLVVANAAHAPVGPFIDMDQEETTRAVDVNCRGPLLLAHRFVPPMVERGRGGVVVVSSIAGFQGSPGIVAYSATKAFGVTFAEGLWGELRGTGVDVIACCAGAVSTPGLARTEVHRAPGTLPPAAVVTATLDRLGQSPRIVPGGVNRVSSFALARLLPRRAAIAIMRRATGAVTGASEGQRPGR
jgi:short-subunit dehydrogenase